MKAVRLTLGRPVPPFGDVGAQVRVLDQPLAEAQDRALAAAGIERVDAPPSDGPYLAFGDHVWFTPELLRRLVAAAPEGGRLRVDDALFLDTTSSLQEHEAPGLYDLAVLPPGPADLSRVAPVVVDLRLEPAGTPELHPRMQHAGRPVRVGRAMVHHCTHWSHVLRVNQLALAARALDEKARFDDAFVLAKLWRILGVLWRSRSLNGYRIARALSEVGPDCDIHPTAVVELSVLGRGVKVGPHAVVRASILADGAVVDEHSTVNLSVVGSKAHIGRFAMVNLAVLYPGCWVSWTNGLQASVVGEDAFLAWGCTLLDMSFGRPVPVEHRGERVDSGQHFLGVAIGHRAVVGHAVKVNYGVAVPEDAVLVAGPEGLLKTWGDAPVGEACRVVDGRPTPIRRS
ncbi:MAG: hypothetical protein H6742_07000 [Alphaproteobacteria bacterium]|nr:hypothetical protein [Alphaproteobacteria bacterium]